MLKKILVVVVLFCSVFCIESRGVSRERRSLIGLARWLVRETGENALKFANYGCYCGYGGQGTPVDDIDKCCQAHDNCYQKATDTNDCWPKWDEYTIVMKQDGMMCQRNQENVCYSNACECDRTIATCIKAALSRQPYNDNFYDYPKEKCRLR